MRHQSSSSSSRTPPPPLPPPSTTSTDGSTTAHGSSSSTGLTPCCTKVGLKRGPWTPEEDQLLINYINREGEGRWRILPKKAGLLRCGKSCRLRWMNYLRPSVKRGHIAADEEDLILRLHRLLGNRWSLIAGRIPGRTDNEIKNYWNTHLSKKLIRQGIDPSTHKPLDPNRSSTRKKVQFARLHKLSTSKDSDHVPTTFQDAKKDTPNEKILTMPADHQFENGQQEENTNDCNEDVLTTFLNSLINEEDFSYQYNFAQQQQQQHLSDRNIASNPDAVMISALPNFNLDIEWDATIMDSTSAAFGVIQCPKRSGLSEHVEEHF